MSEVKSPAEMAAEVATAKAKTPTVAPKATEVKATKKDSYKVVSEFRSRHDFEEVNKVGAEFKSEDLSMVQDLLDRGLIEKA